VSECNCIISRMRNCLPKIASVFRSKSSTTAAHSNESDVESDTDRYIIATKAKAKATTAVTTESDQLLDNANKIKSQQQQQRTPATKTTTTTTTTAKTTTLCADDVDKNRLISAVRAANSNVLDLEQRQQNNNNCESSNNNLNRNPNPTATNGSIRQQMQDSNLDTEMKVAGGEISLALPLASRMSRMSISSKTPEQMELEYEANVAAERGDIMTPLPRDPRSQAMTFVDGAGIGSGVGRNMQPEIVEAIRNLDTQALRLNNLTLEDRCKLTHKPDESTDSVVLRPKVFPFDRQCHSLYERRLHKGPKLHLWVGNGKKPAPSSDSDDEFKTFQVLMTSIPVIWTAWTGHHKILKSRLIIYELIGRNDNSAKTTKKTS